MCALMVQHGCDDALETLRADMEAEEKAALMKKAYSTLILCSGDRVLQEVTKETTVAGSEEEAVHIKDEDQALMLLTSLPLFYENFVETLLYGRKSLTMEDVLATINVKELKKRTEGTKEEAEGHLKRNCPRKKSSGFVQKGNRNQDSDSSDDEGNTYFGEALVIVGNDEMTGLVMDSGGSYHMTHMRDFLYDFGSVQLGDNRTCTIKGTRLSGYDDWDQTKNCVYTLKAKVMTFGVQKHRGSKQVGFKQLGHKQVGFKQLGLGVQTGVHGVQDEKRIWFEVKLQGAQGDREAEVFQVNNDDVAVAQRRLEDKQPEEKTNTDCLGADGNVAEKKKANESMKVNLEKLLKYNAWSTRWSLVRVTGKMANFVAVAALRSTWTVVVIIAFSA
nr:retrovirus-related Pol polyprotein from transposon TNT 1-94 [Tanacetum cinerariifolium]